MRSDLSFNGHLGIKVKRGRPNRATRAMGAIRAFVRRLFIS